MAGRRKRKDMHLAVEEPDMETPKVISAFSIPAMHQVFSEFGGMALGILKSIGFDGLKKIKKNIKPNHQLAFWLLRNMDPTQGSVMFREGKRKKISNEDVQLILGLQSGPVTISFSALSEQNLDKAAHLLFLDPRSTVTLQHLEYLLTVDYEEHMSEQEKVDFTIAAILYADAYFLSRKGNHPKINKKLLQLLCSSPPIGEWNWGLCSKCSAASIRVQEALRQSNKTITLDGCLMLIQIFYLDNLDFGSMVLPYISIPRVLDFSVERFKLYVATDRNDKLKCSFGMMKKRSDAVYHWTGKHWFPMPLITQNSRRCFRGAVLQFISKLI